MPNLALFDFDNTITVNDNFTPFVLYAVPNYRVAAGAALLSPLLAAYKTGALPATKIRAAVAMLGFFGRSEADVRQSGYDYARKQLPKFIRPEALRRIAWHKSQGDKVVVVSASLDVYLTEWCRQHELDLICTILEARGGKMTGRYLGGDCTGVEKARRLRARHNLGAYDSIFAYGDSEEDQAMLALASKKFFRWRCLDDAKELENAANFNN